MPKLAQMGIPMTILDTLTSTQFTEVVCMGIVILYQSKAQEMGIPNYISDCYMSSDLTADMAMEKMRFISPALHFNILRNMYFFTEDRFGICTSFHQADLRDPTEDSTVQRPHSPPNDSLPMETDSGCKV
jgi:hypothetical protein